MEGHVANLDVLRPADDGRGAAQESEDHVEGKAHDSDAAEDLHCEREMDTNQHLGAVLINRHDPVLPSHKSIEHDSFYLLSRFAFQCVPRGKGACVRTEILGAEKAARWTH